jgi:hypothetical protein
MSFRGVANVWVRDIQITDMDYGIQVCKKVSVCQRLAFNCEMLGGQMLMATESKIGNSKGHLLWKLVANGWPLQKLTR